LVFLDRKINFYPIFVSATVEHNTHSQVKVSCLLSKAACLTLEAVRPTGRHKRQFNSWPLSAALGKPFAVKGSVLPIVASSRPVRSMNYL